MRRLHRGALALILISATAYAALAKDLTPVGSARAGRELLEGVYSRFIEGFATADLRNAKSLLDESE